MGVELWWLPSVIVFGVAAASVVVIALALRRRARRRALTASADADRRARQAAISLVRADDAVQAASDELGFAVAQFGEHAVHEFREALEASRRELRDAFALQQKLDDAIPDTLAVRLRWTEQIQALADAAADRLHEHTGRLDARRGVERRAPGAVEQLRQRQRELAARLQVADAGIDRLAAGYAADALTRLRAAASAARTAEARADAAIEGASARLAAGRGDTVGDDLTAAEHALFLAGRSLGQVAAATTTLHQTAGAVEEAMAAAASRIADARGLRDRHEEPEARAALDQAIGDTEQELLRLSHPDRPRHPAADLVALREVTGRLDRAHSDARNRQMRLENARDALSGALLTAESQIAVTRDFISHNRSRVGAGARTRLAEAERQLTLARAEADPVTALDTARRAMTHATDADALARFDTH